MGIASQSLVSRPNPTYLRNEFVVKVYVLLLAIRPTDGNDKTGGPLRVFQ